MKKIMSYFNLLPLSFKLILGFTVICVIIIFFMTVAAFFNRPNQIQKLESYEQKLVSISSYKVNEDHYATGRNSQVYNFKIIYEHIEFEKIKVNPNDVKNVFMSILNLKKLKLYFRMTELSGVNIKIDI